MPQINGSLIKGDKKMKFLHTMVRVKGELMVAVDNRIYMYFNLPVDPITTMKWTDVDHISDEELFRDID